MEKQVRHEITSKLSAIGVSPFDSRLLSQKWRLLNLTDLASPGAGQQIGAKDEVWLELTKRPQKFQRRYYPSGQVSTEQIRDCDKDHFSDHELISWHESGNLKLLSLRVSRNERQFIIWNDDGEVSHRTIDRKSEPYERFVCLNCGDHTLIDGIGDAGFGDSGYVVVQAMSALIFFGGAFRQAY